MGYTLILFFALRSIPSVNLRVGIRGEGSDFGYFSPNVNVPFPLAIRDPWTTNNTENMAMILDKKKRLESIYSGLLISFVLETIMPSFLWGLRITASMPLSSSRA